MIRLHHLEVLVRDVSRSRDWYVSNFGLKSWFDTPHQTIAVLEDDDDQVITLIEDANVVMAQSRGVAFHFQVDDVDEIYRSLVARGVKFEKEPQKITGGHGAGEYGAELFDPDGYCIRLFDKKMRSPLFPPETSLLDNEYAPEGFQTGIQILNDDATPMEFVVTVLESALGLSKDDATRTMLDIHRRDGVVLPIRTPEDSQRIAATISAEAAKYSYPLSCRAIDATRK